MNALNRVIFNTSIQYIRSGISVIISLYTTRVILNALGASDFGIYSLIGGIIAMLSFIQNSLVQTTQRFLSFYIGKDDVNKQKLVFNNSVNIQLILAFLLIAILFIVKPIIFNHYLNIEVERIDIALKLYDLMVGTLFFTMFSIPYMAVLLARENITYYTIVNLIDSFLLLPIAWSIERSPIDRLLWYGLLLALIKVINYFLYYLYSKFRYTEYINYSFTIFDKELFREMWKFSGWITYGAACPIVRNQGYALLINRTLGTVVNASYGIALQVFGQIGIIPSSIMNAIMPQIVKAEGNGNREKMIRLSEIASKFCIVLVGMIAIPLIVDMEFLLKIWLGDVPTFCSEFCRLLVLACWFDQLTIGLASSNQAVGQVKRYTLIISNVKISALIIAIFSISFGMQPQYILVVFALCELVSSILRIFVLKYEINISIRKFTNNVYRGIFIPIFSSFILCYLINMMIENDIRILITFFISIITIGLCTYFFGLCPDEKNIINGILSLMLNLNKRKKITT